MNADRGRSITLATGYHARARPLWEGRVDTRPLKLTVLPMRNDGERHRRFLDGEFDASEFSLALYLALKPRGAAFTALPVFPNRRFRHGFIYVRKGSAISVPTDLKGKAVGVPSYLNTCGLWARGMLKDDYDIRPSDILWKAVRTERDLVPPDGVKIEALPAKSLQASLLDGTLDAVISPEAIEFAVGGVGRLFPDAKAREKDYYVRTKVFPISHAVVVRQQVIDDNPTIVQQLFDAWSEAKRLALQDDEDPTYSNFAWIRDLWEEERELFGTDPWPYGLTQNREAVKTLIRYALEQGILRENIKPAFLFYPIDE